DNIVAEIKKHTILPVLLFPGDINQITDRADALLFLSLISGRNAEYLIGKHVKAIPKLRTSNLEVISTGYILIENGKKTAVESVTETMPMPIENIHEVVDTAIAGEFLGMKLMYLEAGSGAKMPVSSEIIRSVKQQLQIPLIVGGGIRNKVQMERRYNDSTGMNIISSTSVENDAFFRDVKHTTCEGHSKFLVAFHSVSIIGKNIPLIMVHNFAIE